MENKLNKAVRALIVKTALAALVLATVGTQNSRASSRELTEKDIVGKYKLSGHNCPLGVRLKWQYNRLNKSLAPGGGYNVEVSFLPNGKVLAVGTTEKIEVEYERSEDGKRIIGTKERRQTCQMAEMAEYKFNPSNLLEPGTILVRELSRSNSCPPISPLEIRSVQVIGASPEQLVLRYDFRKVMKGTENLEGQLCNQGVSDWTYTRIE